MKTNLKNNCHANKITSVKLSFLQFWPFFFPYKYSWTNKLLSLLIVCKSKQRNAYNTLQIQSQPSETKVVPTFQSQTQRNRRLRKEKRLKPTSTQHVSCLFNSVNSSEFKYPTFLTRMSSSLLKLNFLNHFSSRNLLLQPPSPRLTRKHQST